jgi:hypothetical protein
MLPAVFRTEPDINGEQIAVDGGWIIKMRAGQERGRMAVADFKEITVNETSRRKKIVFGEKEQLLQVLVQGPATFSLMLPAERSADVDGLSAAIDAAKSEPGSGQ